MRPARHARWTPSLSPARQPWPPTGIEVRGAGRWYPSRTRSSAYALASAITRSRFIVTRSASSRKPRRLASAALDEGQQISASRGQIFDRARQHLLRSTTPGNEPDADFHQPDVALGGSLHAVAVERDLAAAPERQARR